MICRLIRDYAYPQPKDTREPNSNTKYLKEALIIKICFSRVCIYESVDPGQIRDFHTVMIQSKCNQFKNKPLSLHHTFPCNEFHQAYVSGSICWVDASIHFYKWITLARTRSWLGFVTTNAILKRRRSPSARCTARKYLTKISCPIWNVGVGQSHFLPINGICSTYFSRIVPSLQNWSFTAWPNVDDGQSPFCKVSWLGSSKARADFTAL